MSVAAQEAVVLRDCLRRGDRHLAWRFFRAAAKPVDAAWWMAAGADLALPQVEGPRMAAVRLANAYLHRVLVAAEHDPVIARVIAGGVDVGCIHRAAGRRDEGLIIC